MDQRHEELLRQLAVLDHDTLESVLGIDSGVDRGCGLDARTAGLVRLSGLVALQSAPQAYEWGVAAALTAGCSEEEVVAVLATLAPVIGAARVSKAAADIATSIGCDAARPG